MLLAGKHACIIQNVMGIKKDERLMLQKGWCKLDLILKRHVKLSIETSEHEDQRYNCSTVPSIMSEVGFLSRENRKSSKLYFMSNSKN